MAVLSNSPNHFLRSLPRPVAEQFEPFLKLVTHPSGTVLFKAEDKIERIYFPYTGIVSYAVGLASGEIVEAGMVGRNSVVGPGAPLDGSNSTNNAIIQVAMSGAAVEVSAVKELVAHSNLLRLSLAEHEEMSLAQVQQVAACNAVHGLEQRLSRWLLQARDLLNADLLPLTQELLAQMLGVHRSSLTLVARRLQEAGLFEYHRGEIRLLDVEALRDVSCECYQAISAHFRRLIRWDPDGH